MPISWTPAAFYTETRGGVPVFQRSRVPGVRNRPVMPDPVNALLIVPIIDETDNGYVGNFLDDLAAWRAVRDAYTECGGAALIGLVHLRQNDGTLKPIYPSNREAEVQEVAHELIFPQQWTAALLYQNTGALLSELGGRVAELGIARLVYKQLVYVIDNSGSTVYGDQIGRVEETLQLIETLGYGESRFSRLESVAIGGGAEWTNERWLLQAATLAADYSPCREVS